MINRLLILFAAVIIASCSGGKKGDGKKYDISFGSLKGPAFTQSIKSDMKVETSVMGFTVNVNMNVNSDIRFELMPDSAGFRQLKMTYETMKMTMDVPMMKQLGETDNVNKELDKAMSMFSGSSVILLVDKNGEISEVLGKEAFQEQIQHNLDSLMTEDDGRKKMEYEKKMEQFYTKEQLQNMLGAMFSVYHNEQVTTGSSWTKEAVSNVNDLKTKIKTKYTLVSVTDGIAEIKVDGKLTSAGSATESGMSMQADINGTQTGTLKLRLENGQVQTSDIKIAMEGKMKVGGLKVPMKLKSVNSIVKK